MGAGRDTATQIGQGVELAVLGSVVEQTAHGSPIEPGDTGKSDPYAIGLELEALGGSVDAGGKDGDAIAAGSLGVNPGGVHALVVVENGRPERPGMVCLEPSRAPGDEAIADGVAFAERVLVEPFEQDPKFGQFGGVHGCAAGQTQEFFTQGVGSDGIVTTGNAFAESIGLGGRQAHDPLDDTQGVIFKDHDAVGGRQ